MINFQSKEKYGVEDLVRIVEILRAPGGCPWDAEQTHESIRRDFLEEVYEAVEAIDEGSREHLLEELGDVLLQVVFHAQLERESQSFDIEDVADGECKKLIFRHPHVFADTQVSSAADVLDKWDELKRREKKQETTTEAMNSVARSLPALWRAEKIQKKAAKVGFDWPDVSGAVDKLSEELTELRNAATPEEQKEELGDLLFAAVNTARFMGVDPEEALNLSSDKFIRRFGSLEAAAMRPLTEMTLDEMEQLYQTAKEKEL